MGATVKVGSRIIIKAERCKGCGLCVLACHRDGIIISKQSNKHGYFPAEVCNGNCDGCTNCAVVCPEAVIEVYREQRIEAVKAAGKKELELIKEKG